MSFRSCFIISACFLFLYPQKEKKEQLLKLSKRYFPENHIVLKEYDESSIDLLARGKSPDEYITDVSTVVHEGYHTYQGFHSSYYDSLVIYRINDTLSFSVKNLKTFPSNQLNAIVPEATRKRVYRYDTYVDARSKDHVTQQFGILGLLEELAAYYQSYHTDIALFNYYSDHYGWKKTGPWIKYLGHMASFRYSITEFELFISWYLQYAKQKHPAVYKEIIQNKGLKEMLSFLHNENIRLASLYDRNRQEIMKRFEGKLLIRDNYIIQLSDYAGKGLYDNEVKEMNGLLAQPEHKVYRDLLQ